SEVLESNRNAVGALLSRARLKFREELRMAQIATDQCPPDCEEIIALLSPYIDGELGGGDKERVESHLEGCTFCMAALEEMREASRSFRMFIPVVPSADVAQAFNRRPDEITGQGAADTGQGDTQGHGDDTLDSAQSQTRGGDIDDATQVMPQGRGGGSGFAHLLRRKAFWIAAVAVLLLLAMAGMLAWGAGGGDEPGAQTVPAAGSETATTSTGSRTQTTVRPTPAVSDTTQQVETTPTTSTTTATTPAASGGTNTPARVTSGYASPDRVYEGQTVSYVSVIRGAAASVTVDLAPQTGGSSISVSLKRTSTGSGTETWIASRAAGASGTYYIYVSAIDAQGQYDSLYVGNLTVSPTIY
ncbi:MAG: zf-HC2 domain-containing protein, partial [Thermoleophilia bacterium]